VERGGIRDYILCVEVYMDHMLHFDLSCDLALPSVSIVCKPTPLFLGWIIGSSSIGHGHSEEVKEGP